MATVLTTMGRQIITGAIHKVGSGPGFNEPLIVAWGTGAGTASSFDRTLFTEVVGEARISGTGVQATTTNTNDAYQVTGTHVAASTETITNVGLLDVLTTPPQTTMNQGGTLTAGGTSLTVTANATFPGAGQYYIQIESEVISVTAGQGTNTWTIARGQLGTTAASHVDGLVVNGTGLGNLFIKADFTGVALNNLDSIAFTIKITFT